VGQEVSADAVIDISFALNAVPFALKLRDPGPLMVMFALANKQFMYPRHIIDNIIFLLFLAILVFIRIVLLLLPVSHNNSFNNLVTQVVITITALLFI